MTEYTMPDIQLQRGPAGTMFAEFEVDTARFMLVFARECVPNLLEYAKEKARACWRQFGRVDLIVIMNCPSIAGPGEPPMPTHLVLGVKEREPDSGGLVATVAQHIAKRFSADELCLVAESWVVKGKKGQRNFKGPVRLHPRRKSAVFVMHECPRSHPLPQMYSAPIDDKKKTLGDWVDYKPGGEGHFAFMLPPSAYPQAGGKA